jgi:methylamine dehydrogenase heavy chain
MLDLSHVSLGSPSQEMLSMSIKIRSTWTRNILLFGLIVSLPAIAEIKPETLTVETFKDAGPHGILVNSLFGDLAEIYNADTGKFMGQISLGAWANAVEIDTENRLFHVAETYLSRHTRGERTDVITSYEFDTLSAKQEVVIPSKHASGLPHRNYTGMTDDGRFMMVNNITPAMSISVVDLSQSKFTGEIATAGCGLVYPTGNRSFLQICGDGALQLITINDDGSENSRVRSDNFFNVDKDPLMEKAVRTNKGWVFNTFQGELFRVSVNGKSIAVESLFNLDQKGEGWRIGGIEALAYHPGSDVLLALMHQGGEDTHKDPGTEIWIFNLSSERLLHKLKLDNMATSITVSQDGEPLIYTMFVGSVTLDIYDLRKGIKVGNIENIGMVPTIVQNLQL